MAKAKQMSKIVFVLGAGASAHCETPLMDNFLVEGFYVYNLDTDVRGRFQRLLGLGAIQKFHYNDASFERAFVDVVKVLGL